MVVSGSDDAGEVDKGVEPDDVGFPSAFSDTGIAGEELASATSSGEGDSSWLLLVFEGGGTVTCGEAERGGGT